MSMLLMVAILKVDISKILKIISQRVKMAVFIHSLFFEYIVLTKVIEVF